MIIVKTKNGAKFINEKEAVMVCHDKERKQVSFHTWEMMQGVTINDVESVTYTTDAQPVEWTDQGNEIERLQAIVKQETSKYSDLMAEYNQQKTIIDEYAYFLHRIAPHQEWHKFLEDELKLLDKKVREKFPKFNVYFGYNDEQ